MKTKEELNALRNEAEALSGKRMELNEDEIALVTGGADDSTAEPPKTLPGWQDQVRMYGSAGGTGGGSGAGIGSGRGGGGAGAGGGSGAAMNSELNTEINGHNGSSGRCGTV